MRAARARPSARRHLARSLASLLLLAGAVQAGAQETEPPGQEQAPEVRFRPRAGSAVQRELARFLEHETYALWTRDSVLARGDTVPGDLLVLEGAVRIAGAVLGAVYVVDGDLFLRPGARITGDVLVLGGGFYSSGMATVEGGVTYRPNEILQVLPEEGGYRILPVGDAARAYELPGLYGFRIPTYQRVDGWTFAWGGLARAVGVPGQPELRGTVRFLTDPEEFEATIEHWWHPSAALRVGGRVGRETRSNDAWIRGDVTNTLSFLLFGNDYRDYYRADHAALVFDVEPPSPWSARFSLAWEDARDLEADDRTVLFGKDSVRANPAVDPGDIIALHAIVDYARRTATVRRAVHLHLEGATEDAAGDFSFLWAEGQVFGRQPLAAGHALEVMALARGDLAGRLPRQRWSALGGIGTLPTFPILGLRGERMFLGELTYLVPIPRLEVPGVGPTEVLLRGAVGSAWSEGQPLRAEENLMAGVRFLFVEAALAIDPGRDDLDPQFYVAGRWPRSLRGF